MATPKYRTAIVGTGAIAHAHAAGVRQHSDRAELTAVVDVDHDRAAVFAGKWGGPKVYPSLTALLGDGQPDVVHVCTPPASHAGLALECLKAGVTVLVEKPPALSLAELDTLATASEASGAHVATVFQHRFGPGADQLRRLAAAGRFGRSLLATCETQWFRDDAYFAVPWRGQWETEGGGPTMGHGIHQFDLLLSVLGPWKSVTAVAARRARKVVTEDVSMAIVSFIDGTVASVVNSLVSPRETSRLRFDYEYATVELEHLYGYTGSDWMITPAAGHEAVQQLWRAESSNEASGHARQLAAVYDALDTGSPPPVTLPETRRTMELVAAIYASAFTGEVVHSGQIGPEHPFAQRMNGTGAPW